MSSRKDPPAPFTVRGRRRNGTITYLCPDAAWVLRKLADFERAGYTDVVVLDATGAAIEPSHLAPGEPGAQEAERCAPASP